MRTPIALALFLGFVPLGCGGSTATDGKSVGAGGGQSGSGGGVSVGGASSGGASSGGASSGGASSGGTGGSATGGQGGQGGGCCSADVDCPQYAEEGLSSVCVNGVCKQVLEEGLCWSDKDCQGLPGACVGASVCPCGADCFAEDTPGKCMVPDQCCSSSNECVSTPESQAVCVAGNCEPKPPPGQCWSDADCAPGTACGGACVCPCGSVCACGGQMGWCEGPQP